MHLQEEVIPDGVPDALPPDALPPDEDDVAGLNAEQQQIFDQVCLPNPYLANRKYSDH